MRIFWILLSLAVLGGLYFVVAPAGNGGKTPAATTAREPAAKTESTSTAPTTKPVEPVAAPAVTPTATVATAKPTVAAPAAAPAIPAPAAAPAAATAPIVNAPANPPAQPAAAISAPETAKAPAGEAEKEATKADSAEAAKTAVTPAAAPQAIPGVTDGKSSDGMFAAAVGSSVTGETVTLPEHPVFRGEKSLPSKAVRKADGTLLVDDRFVLKGSGTAADPYIAPWDMIISAQETYKPRLGMTKIPQRVSMLDGKYVKIVGFIAFPITAASPKEALVMLNQWDGCCIGTPPTPYDAIEVKLASPATGGQKVMASGAMTGIFKVDPYEDGGWLLGLFMMEDATLTAGEPQ